MSNAVLFVSFKLKKGVSVPDFLVAAEKLNNEYMSKQKGYISWKQLYDGKIWADYITFETMEDAKRIEDNENPCELALKFYSFINLPSCKTNYYTVERNYE